MWTRASARRVVLLAALVALAAAATPSAQPVSLVVRNVGIVGPGAPATVVGTVVVRDGRIVYAGASAGAPSPTGAQVVDGTGRFLVPGLIDMHTHVSKTRGSSLGLLVAHGVTTVRDMGGDHAELLRWRQEITAGRRLGPHLLIAGPYLESASNAARQHNTPSEEMAEPVERTRIGVGSLADADRVIAEVAARGVDHLKIRTVQDRATYLAIGAAARRHGLPLTGHFQPFDLADVFASGQRSIEHAPMPSLQVRPAAERADFIARLARESVAVVPTLVVLESLGGPSDAALKATVDEAEHGSRRVLSAFLRADWREQLAEQGPDRQRFYAEVRRNARLDFTEMRAAGVRILAGTDIGVLNVMPGRSLHEELALLVKDLGMTPYEALLAGTAYAAAFLGVDRETGTLEVGKRADMLLVDANPLDRIENLSRIAGVFLGGRYFDRAGILKIVDGESVARPVLQRLAADAMTEPATPPILHDQDLEVTPCFEAGSRSRRSRWRWLVGVRRLACSTIPTSAAPPRPTIIRSSSQHAGFVCSMSRRGDWYDAVLESFFSTVKSELRGSVRQLRRRQDGVVRLHRSVL